MGNHASAANVKKPPTSLELFQLSARYNLTIADVEFHYINFVELWGWEQVHRLGIDPKGGAQNPPPATRFLLKLMVDETQSYATIDPKHMPIPDFPHYLDRLMWWQSADPTVKANMITQLADMDGDGSVGIQDLANVLLALFPIDHPVDLSEEFNLQQQSEQLALMLMESVQDSVIVDANGTPAIPLEEFAAKHVDRLLVENHRFAASTIRME